MAIVLLIQVAILIFFMFCDLYYALLRRNEEDSNVVYSIN